MPRPCHGPPRMRPHYSGRKRKKGKKGCGSFLLGRCGSCRPLEQQAEGLDVDTNALEEQLKHASSAEKPGILKQIAALEKKRAKAEVALQKCRKTHPKP